MSVRIGQLAHAASVPAKTIRYYEEIGLLPPPERRPNGYREYDDAAGERLRFVKAAQAVGFTLAEIGEILSLRDRGHEPCARVLELVDRRARQIAEQVAALEAMQADLGRLAARSRQHPVEADYCQLIQRG